MAANTNISSDFNSSLSQQLKSDCLYALQLQLQEAGAGEIQLQQLQSCFQDGPVTNAIVADHSFAHSLQSNLDNIAQDYNFARHIAMTQNGMNNLCINNTANQQQQKHQHQVEHETQPKQQQQQSNPQNISQNIAQDNEPLNKSDECGICFEQFNTVTLFDAGSCHHKYCNSCIVRYFDEVARNNKPYPVTCPGCHVEIENERILGVLSGTGRSYHTFERFIINREHMKRVRYCSNEECGVPFEWRLDGAGSANGEMKEDEIRVICPVCTKQTCANCRSRWHEGQTCRQYNSLVEGKSLAKEHNREKEWTNCPKCGHLVEKRAGDCNHVICICDCHFCHRCGAEYLSRKRTARNLHGIPGCECGLFSNAR